MCIYYRLNIYIVQKARWFDQPREVSIGKIGIAVRGCHKDVLENEYYNCNFLIKNKGEKNEKIKKLGG